MSAPSSYEAQHRGTAGAYEAYFAGMDRTMQQKLAFVGAHFLLDPGARPTMKTRERRGRAAVRRRIASRRARISDASLAPRSATPQRAAMARNPRNMVARSPSST